MSTEISTGYLQGLKKSGLDCQIDRQKRNLIWGYGILKKRWVEKKIFSVSIEKDLPRHDPMMG